MLLIARRLLWESKWLPGFLLPAACLYALPAAAQLPTVPPAPPASVAVREVQVAQPNAARFPEVTLYVRAKNAAGGPATGLEQTPGVFQVMENGKPASITSVTSQGNHLDVCLALDCSYSMDRERKLELAKVAAKAFAQQLGPRDQAALVSFAEGSTLEQPLTGDREALEAALDRARPSGGTTTFYDGLYWAITQVALRPGGSVLTSNLTTRADARRVVVALSDGEEVSSRVKVDELVSYARSNGVSLCMIALGKKASRERMRWFALQTGGRYLYAPSPQQLQKLYADLAQELRQDYRVTFRSPQPEADATRRDVVLTAMGAALPATTWYQAPGRGSLLVTVPAGTAASGSVGSISTGPATGTPQNGAPVIAAIVGAVLLLAIGGAGGILWYRSRTIARLPILDSNPRIDLMPLWVRQGSTRVGRGRECELVLDSTSVSRIHARIEAWAGAFRVVDEGSRNGTYVNGERVKGTHALRPGDRIRFGDREFSFAGELTA